MSGDQADEFMIGDHDEHPGTQREDPSGFTNDEFGNRDIDPRHVR